MFCLYGKLFLLFAVIQLLSPVLSENSINDYYHIYQHDDSYHGEKFPQKYLSIDGVQPTTSDFSLYLESLARVVNYFTKQPNETDPNVGIGSFLMKAVLKRILIDYSDKIKGEEKKIIRDLIHKTEDIVSHYVYDNHAFGPKDIGYRLSRIFTYDDSLVYSIRDFKKNAMTKWINSDITVNDYIEEFDNLSCPKETYAELVMSMDDYYLIPDSDFCITQISTQPMPLRINAKMKPCRPDPYCTKRVLRMPSVAYALSHRLLYLVVLAHTRRCYVISEEAHNMHMDIMCANMYRETVYLARRGYFFRDLFLEHIALCSLLGYEEFHRNNWFKKSASWVDEDGCVNENRNFSLNRTRISISHANSTKEKNAIRKSRRKSLLNDCQHHQMALVMNVLAYAMRHAAHYMKTVS